MSIDWHTIIANALTQVGIAGLAISAVAWLAKKIGSNRLADDAEKFKIEIQARADSEIERTNAFRSARAVSMNANLTFCRAYIAICMRPRVISSD